MEEVKQTKHYSNYGVLRVNPNDIIGKRFGRLVVTNYIGYYREEVDSKYPTRTRHLYQVRCDCGNITTANRRSLMTGHKKSCGCLKKKTNKKTNK